MPNDINNEKIEENDIEPASENQDTMEKNKQTSHEDTGEVMEEDEDLRELFQAQINPTSRLPTQNNQRKSLYTRSKRHHIFAPLK